jgi:hypothetical protein
MPLLPPPTRRSVRVERWAMTGTISARSGATSAQLCGRAILAYSGGRRDVADDAVAEAFARTIERDDQVRDPKAYLYRLAFRIASAELRRDGDASETNVDAASSRLPAS